MKRTGFTLIELIISFTVLTIIIVSVYSVFYMGIKAWRKGSGEASVQKVRIKLLKLQKELKSSFFFSQITFKGASAEMIFPLSVSKEDGEKVYIINYYVDGGEDKKFKKLVRKERLFKEGAGDENQEIIEVMFLIKAMRFEYAYRSNSSPEGLAWQDYWDASQGKLPSAIRISFELDDSGEIYNKIIFIPQGELG